MSPTAAAASLESIVPFRRSGDVTKPVAVSIRGDIPDWLRGDLVRTCPAVFATGGWRAQHWFDGLCMVYAFNVDGPDGVSFHSTILDSEAAREAAAGRARLASFGSPLVRSFWQRALEPVPRVTDNTNVNVVSMGDDLVAMTESDRQNVVDRQTLAVRGRVAYHDDLGTVSMSAHPHMDFARERVVNVATALGPSPAVTVYEHAPSSRRRTAVGSFRVKEMPYIHSFGLTPKSAVVIAHPFTVRPMSLLWSNRPFVDHFRWRPKEGMRLVLLDRQGGKPREHVTDACFVFHTVNAFERDGETVIDVLAYPDADIVARTRVDRMASGLPDLRPSLVRITMRPGTERAHTEKLSDVGFEFPATNYKRVIGQAYRYAWGTANQVNATGEIVSKIVAIDVTTGAARSFCDGDHVFGEPVFVARPRGEGEDDGVLLTVGSSQRQADSAALAVLDARTLDVLATAEVPVSIPLGFHGSFLRRSIAPASNGSPRAS